MKTDSLVSFRSQHLRMNSVGFLYDVRFPWITCVHCGSVLMKLKRRVNLVGGVDDDVTAAVPKDLVAEGGYSSHGGHDHHTKCNMRDICTNNHRGLDSTRVSDDQSRVLCIRCPTPQPWRWVPSDTQLACDCLEASRV